MKKIKIGKKLPFDINKLYEVQKYIYNSQVFFNKFNEWVKKLEELEKLLDNGDITSDVYVDVLIAFRFDIEVNYNNLKKECSLCV